MGYDTFADEEPNSEGGNEDCLELYNTGKWNDKPCSKENRVMCSRNENGDILVIL